MQKVPPMLPPETWPGKSLKILVISSADALPVVSLNPEK
jgi:hypothetical protein